MAVNPAFCLTESNIRSLLKIKRDATLNLANIYLLIRIKWYHQWTDYWRASLENWELSFTSCRRDPQGETTLWGTAIITARRFKCIL
jgi:hypothetical protein